MSGKGSGRRPAAISASEADANWARTFGKADSERCKGAPVDQNAETIPRVLDGGPIGLASLYREMAKSGRYDGLNGDVRDVIRRDAQRLRDWIEPIRPTGGA